MSIKVNKSILVNMFGESPVIDALSENCLISKLEIGTHIEGRVSNQLNGPTMSYVVLSDTKPNVAKVSTSNSDMVCVADGIDKLKVCLVTSTDVANSSRVYMSKTQIRVYVGICELIG